MQNQRGETVVFNFIAQIRPAPFVQECFPCEKQVLIVSLLRFLRVKQLRQRLDVFPAVYQYFDAFALMLRN